MQFDVFTLIPGVFPPYLDSSILQRARQRGLIEVVIHNIRDWTTDRHHVTDDLPSGGGGGMVMKVEPVFAAVEGVLGIPPACPKKSRLCKLKRSTTRALSCSMCANPRNGTKLTSPARP